MLTEARGKKFWLKLLLAATLCFIWGNSLFSREYSSQESGLVLEIFNSLFGDGTVTERFIRKLAHFTEFALLGAELFGLFERYPLSVAHALFAAVADESLQIISGRSAEVKDVLLDFAGSLVGAALCLCLFYLSSRKKAKKKLPAKSQQLEMRE